MSDYKTVFVGLEYTIVAHSWSQSVIPENDKKSITWKIEKDGKDTDLTQTGESVKYKFKQEEQGKRIKFKAFYKTQKDPVVILVYVSKCNVAPYWLDGNGNQIEKAPYGKQVQFELLFQNFKSEKTIQFTVRLENENKSFSEEVFSTGKNGCKVINNKTGINLEIKEEWRNNGPKETLYDLYLSVRVEGISPFDKGGDFFGNDDICKERLLIKDFFVDEEGFVINPKVQKAEQKNIYSINSFKDKKKVHAVVLHRTDGKKGSATLGPAKEPGQGGHFTIEGGAGEKTKELSGIDGQIYQFGSLKKSVSHVGKIRKRPSDSTPKQQWDPSSTTSHQQETKKSYPDRFPYNGDSIGIEVVGKCLTSEEERKKNRGMEADWETLTKEQISNVAWLVNGLLDYFGLDKNDDLYVHEQISSKTWDEGGVVLRAVKPYLK